MWTLKNIILITDVQHGWRRNSLQTDVVAIETETHKCLRVEVVTNDDDNISQRHEAIGTQRLYGHFANVFDGDGLEIEVHAHDAAAAMNNIIKKVSPDTKTRMIHSMYQKVQRRPSNGLLVALGTNLVKHGTQN